MTMAQELYNQVDVDSFYGVDHEVTNFCAYHESDVEIMETGRVVFYDGSAISFDDYSVEITD